MTITHEEISKRAREIWDREGRPEGRDKEHWLQAETELSQESLQTQANHVGVSESNSVMKMSSEALPDGGSRKRQARRGK
jgi:hypothetical protein